MSSKPEVLLNQDFDMVKARIYAKPQCNTCYGKGWVDINMSRVQLVEDKETGKMVPQNIPFNKEDLKQVVRCFCDCVGVR